MIKNVFKRSLMLAFCLSVFSYGSINAQYFEGEVKYDISIEAKIDSLDGSSLAYRLGGQQTYSFKGTNLRIDYPAGDFKIYLENPDLGRAYLLKKSGELQSANLTTKSYTYNIQGTMQDSGKNF